MKTRTPQRRNGRRHASPIEETTIDLQTLRAQLIAGRERILHRVDHTDGDLHSLHDEHARPSELEEGAQEGHLLEVLAHLGEHDRRELAAIDAALSRFSTGEYGICLTCEEEIPRARLAVLPTASTCVECAERQARAPRFTPVETFESLTD